MEFPKKNKITSNNFDALNYFSLSRKIVSDQGVMQIKKKIIFLLCGLIVTLIVSGILYWLYGKHRIELQGRMCEGLAAVRIDGKWGHIDGEGNIAIAPQFDWVGEFHEGSAAFQAGDRFGFIDRQGIIQIEARFKTVRHFSEGVAAVELDDGKWGYIDKTGDFVLEPQYDCALPFSEGMASALRNPGGYGYIDRTGTFVIAPQFSGGQEFSQGLAAVEVSTRVSPTLMKFKSGYINRDGEMVIEPQFTFAYPFSHGYALIRKLDSPEWWYIDREGNLVEGPQRNWRLLEKPEEKQHNKINPDGRIPAP